MILVHRVPARRQPSENLKVAVVSPGREGYSITFVRAHAKHLPGEVAHLYGGALPIWVGTGRALPPRSMHVLARLLARTTHRSFERVLSFLAPRIPKRFRILPLARFLAAQGFDVVLAEFGYTGVAMMDVCRRAGIPLVVHFHGSDAHDKRIVSQFHTQYRRLFVAAEALIAVSDEMVEQLISLGAPRDKVRLNPCGVDTTLFAPLAGMDREPEREREPEVLAVGRFVEKKAPHLTLLAFRDVAESVPEARLVMVGDGPLLDSCRSLAVALRVADQVDFLGPLPHEEVARRMKDAACFVQHSVTAPSGDKEGTPVSVLEAAASGLPVVATRHAGIADFVVHGETGFLVDEHDYVAMASYVIRLLKDPALAHRLGAAGRTRILKGYSMAQSTAGLADILRDAVASHRSGHCPSQASNAS